MITKSGLDTNNFESCGTGSLQPVLADLYSAKVSTGLYVLSNKNGSEATITNFGARLVSMMVPDNNGEFRDVVLGFDNIKDYTSPKPKDQVFGAVIGRYANRISKPNKGVESGDKYEKPVNNGEAILHGGPFGWQYQTFDVVEYDKSAGKLKLKLISPDGDSGFHGLVTFYVTYSLDDEDNLTIEYKATTTKPTVINVTNHSYFNLSGDMTNRAIDHFAFINSRFVMPARAGALPTGEILKIKEDGDFDFCTNAGKPIDRDIFSENDQIELCDGYDHNFILTKKGNIDAALIDMKSGISMIITTDQPAIQLYTAYHLDGMLVGKGGVEYNSYAGVCLETQHYPDSPNFSHFPTCTLLPGHIFKSYTTYSFSTLATSIDEVGEMDAIADARTKVILANGLIPK